MKKSPRVYRRPFRRRRCYRPRLRFNASFPPWARDRLDRVGLREFFTAPFWVPVVPIPEAVGILVR